MRRVHGNLTRIHMPSALAPGAVIALHSPAAHHLLRVLRAEVGDEIVVFNSGIEFAAAITHIDKHGVSVKLGPGNAVDRESPLACTLAQAISGGERMDFTLQKAVELGVARVQPLYSERSVVRLDSARAAKRSAHWRQVMISACEQCGRNIVPELGAPVPIIDWLSGLKLAQPEELRWLLTPYAHARLAERPQPRVIMLLAGPEGGLSAAETELAQLRGFIAMRLGPRVLRTETAALAALAAVQTLWGDF